MESREFTYCRICGQVIDPDSKKCRGCGKQYPKALSLQSAMILLLTIIMITSLLGNILLTLSTDKLSKNLSEAKKEISTLDNKNDKQRSENRKLEQQIKNLEEKNKEYTEKVTAMTAENDFFNKFIVLVADNGSKTYHKYNCSIFQNCDSFWAYNTVAAISEGYYPCSNCCN